MVAQIRVRAADDSQGRPAGDGRLTLNAIVERRNAAPAKGWTVLYRCAHPHWIPSQARRCGEEYRRSLPA